MLRVLIGLLTGVVLSTFVEFVGYHVSQLRRGFWDHPPLFFGYHIHHSVLGLLCVVIGLFDRPELIGFGIGIIVVHTISDRRLVFIEKVK